MIKINSLSVTLYKGYESVKTPWKYNLTNVFLHVYLAIVPC